jgi:hypothetical protein
MDRRQLPIGIQTFAKIREGDFYYVDKTAFALRLIEQGSHYFLSRPRRFGKSLFLDTLGELLAGNEPLFRGLFVHDKWDWTVHYPVLRFSFAEGVFKSAAALQERIVEQLQAMQQAFNIRCVATSIAGSFLELIRTLHQQSGVRVVILVDEYDKPILDNITNPEIAREMRDGLRDLYSVIKGADAHIKFAFLTGVSKFSKVSIFSGLNNLNDITLDAHYAAICGYTETDLETVFAPELPGLDRVEIRRWYNGYNWLGEAVYNPFDLLLLFDKHEFRPFWFETGTPTFLIDLLMQRQVFAPDLARIQTSADLLGRFDVDDIAIEALLFQTGYLTIGETIDIPGRRQYVLRYPNLEVQTSLNTYLGGALVHDAQTQNRLTVRLYQLLLANDFAGLRQLFHTFFAGIPHDWYRNNTIARYEGYYTSVFYTYFAGLGMEVIPEDATAKGRIDMTVLVNGQVYIFEFKVVEESPQGSALAQIKARDYAAKYRGRGEPIHLIGVEFAKETRNIVGFEVESLGTEG